MKWVLFNASWNGFQRPGLIARKVDRKVMSSLTRNMYSKETAGSLTPEPGSGNAVNLTWGGIVLPSMTEIYVPRGHR